MCKSELRPIQCQCAGRRVAFREPAANRLFRQRSLCRPNCVCRCCSASEVRKKTSDLIDKFTPKFLVPNRQLPLCGRRGVCCVHKKCAHSGELIPSSLGRFGRVHCVGTLIGAPSWMLADLCAEISQSISYSNSSSGAFVVLHFFISSYTSMK